MFRQEEYRALGLTAEELATVLNGITPIEVEVDRKQGSHSSYLHLKDFGDALQQKFGLRMFGGSLNLWADKPVRLPDPLELSGTGEWMRERGFFSPVVMEGRALGFAFRVHAGDDQEFIEVFAHTHLKTRLDIDSGDRVSIQLVPGSALGI